MEQRILELIAFFTAENFRTPEVIYLNKYDLLVFEGEILRNLRGVILPAQGANLTHFHGIKIEKRDIEQGEILIG